MNDYEREREERVARNKAALADLTKGLLLAPQPTAPTYRGTTSVVDASYDHEAAAARRRQREEERENALLLARRSLRARGLEPVTESSSEMQLRLQWAEEARIETDKRRAAREQMLAEARSRGEVTTRCGRPVTWIGGGGQDPATLARMGVPELRSLFRELFGQETASNNSNWLRKKLAEPPADDAEGGARRAAHPRARDVSASIWMGSGGTDAEGRPIMMMRPARADPCLLEAQKFITHRPVSKLPTPAPAGASKMAPRPSASGRAPRGPSAAPSLSFAPGKWSVPTWGATRVRSAVARQRLEEQRAAPPPPPPPTVPFFLAPPPPPKAAGAGAAAGGLQMAGMRTGEHELDAAHQRKAVVDSDAALMMTFPWMDGDADAHRALW